MDSLHKSRSGITLESTPALFDGAGHGAGEREREREGRRERERGRERVERDMHHHIATNQDFDNEPNRKMSFMTRIHLKT